MFVSTDPPPSAQQSTPIFTQTTPIATYDKSVSGKLSDFGYMSDKSDLSGIYNTSDSGNLSDFDDISDSNNQSELDNVGNLATYSNYVTWAL